MVKKEILERIEDIYNTFGFEMYGESEKHRCDSNFIIDNFEEIKDAINNDEEHSKMLDNIVKRIRLHSLDILGYHTIVYEECHNMNLHDFIEYAENYNRNEEKYKYEVETEIGKIDAEKGPKKPIMIQTKEDFEKILNYGEEKIKQKYVERYEKDFDS